MLLKINNKIVKIDNKIILKKYEAFSRPISIISDNKRKLWFNKKNIKAAFLINHLVFQDEKCYCNINIKFKQVGCDNIKNDDLYISEDDCKTINNKFFKTWLNRKICDFNKNCLKSIVETL